jgi:hypothetical protein
VCNTERLAAIEKEPARQEDIEATERTIDSGKHHKRDYFINNGS